MKKFMRGALLCLIATGLLSSCSLMDLTSDKGIEVRVMKVYDANAKLLTNYTYSCSLLNVIEYSTSDGKCIYSNIEVGSFNIYESELVENCTYYRYNGYVGHVICEERLYYNIDKRMLTISNVFSKYTYGSSEDDKGYNYIKSNDYYRLSGTYYRDSIVPVYLNNNSLLVNEKYVVLGNECIVEYNTMERK